MTELSTFSFFLIISSQCKLENKISSFRLLFLDHAICKMIIQKDEVENMNKELKLLCKRRNLQLLHTFRIFLHNNKPIRSYFAINDSRFTF